MRTLNAVTRLIRREPVAFQGCVQASLAALVGFGVVTWSSEQVGLMLAVVAAFLALFTRRSRRTSRDAHDQHQARHRSGRTRQAKRRSSRAEETPPREGSRVRRRAARPGGRAAGRGHSSTVMARLGQTWAASLTASSSPAGGSGSQQHDDAVLVTLVEHLRGQQHALSRADALVLIDTDLHRESSSPRDGQLVHAVHEHLVLEPDLFQRHRQP